MDRSLPCPDAACVVVRESDNRLGVVWFCFEFEGNRSGHLLNPWKG